MSPKLHTQSAPARGLNLNVETLEDRNVPAVGAAAFVQSVYQTVLNRDADQIGLKGYVYRLDNGASRDEIASEIWRSQEHRSVQIQDLYGIFTGRQATLAEQKGWLDFFNAGHSYEDALASFATSQEFINQKMTTKELIIGFYQNVLGRTPTTAEVSQYTDAITKGQIDRRGVVDGMIEGAEFRGNAVDGLFQAILGRDADSTAHNGYAVALAGRTDIDDLAVTLLASNEFSTPKAVV